MHGRGYGATHLPLGGQWAAQPFGEKVKAEELVLNFCNIAITLIDGLWLKHAKGGARPYLRSVQRCAWRGQYERLIAAVLYAYPGWRTCPRAPSLLWLRRMLP